MANVPIIEIAQLTLNILGAVLSLSSFASVIRDNIKSREAGVIPSSGLVARIRIRREAIRLCIHFMFILSGFYVYVFRVNNTLDISPVLMLGATRNISIIMVTIFLMLDTVFDRFDRHAVFVMVQREKDDALRRNRRATDQPPSGTVVVESHDHSHKVAVTVETTENGGSKTPIKSEE